MKPIFETIKKLNELGKPSFSIEEISKYTEISPKKVFEVFYENNKNLGFSKWGFYLSNLGSQEHSFINGKSYIFENRAIRISPKSDIAAQIKNTTIIIDDRTLEIDDNGFLSFSYEDKNSFLSIDDRNDLIIKNLQKEPFSMVNIVDVELLKVEWYE